MGALAQQMLAHSESQDSMTYLYDIRQSLADRRDPANGPNPERTICDAHREAFVIARNELTQVAPDQSARLMELLAEAFDMGKRMSNKLFRYSGAQGFAARGLASQKKNESKRFDGRSM